MDTSTSIGFDYQHEISTWTIVTTAASSTHGRKVAWQVNPQDWPGTGVTIDHYPLLKVLKTFKLKTVLQLRSTGV
jgi:hypothetical protein